MSARSDADTDKVTYTGVDIPNPALGVTLLGLTRLRVDRDTFSTLFRFWSGSGTTITVQTDTSGVLLTVFSLGNLGGIAGAMVLTVDAWVNWALTVNGTAGILYLAPFSGPTVSSSGVVSGGSPPTGLTFFGRSPSDNTEWYNGGGAYYRMWNEGVVLGQSAIEAEWASPVPVRTADLWSFWPLSTGTDLADASGHGRHLTAGSTALTTEDDPPLGNPGTLTGTLPALTGTVAAQGSTAGLLAGTLAPMVGAATGFIGNAGTLVGLLPLLVGHLQESDLSGELIGTLPVLGGLPTPVDIEEEIQRWNTHLFILADPQNIELTPVQEVALPSGGVRLAAQVPRRTQVFRLIPMSHTERPVRSTSAATSTSSGVTRKYDYTLLGEWDAELRENDWWVDAAGQRLVIDALVSNNGYERKGLVTSHGRRPTHGE